MDAAVCYEQSRTEAIQGVPLTHLCTSRKLHSMVSEEGEGLRLGSFRASRIDGVVDAYKPTFSTER